MCHLRGQSARFAALLFSSFLVGAFTSSQLSKAQCTDPVPSTPIEGLVAAQPVLDWGWCVAMRENGDFTIVWIDDTPPGKLGVVRAQRYCRSGSLLGVSAALTDAGGTRSSLSVASSRLGHYCVTWTSAPGDAAPSILTTHLQEFDFDDFTFATSTPSADYNDHFPSAGASDAITNRATVSWSNAHENEGLHYAIDGAQAGTLRTCDTLCPARANFWNPCVSTRSEDGITAIVFAFDEIPVDLDSPWNIAIIVIDQNGAILEQLVAFGT